jgi:hypothetical protein
MDETFSRASFDATIDDLVEVTLRGWHKSAGIQRARRNTMLWTGTTIALVLLTVARPLWGERSWLAVVLLVPVPLGALIAYLVGPAYDRSMQNRIRRSLVEGLHGSTTLRCEVELRSSGLWIMHLDASSITHVVVWPVAKAAKLLQRLRLIGKQIEVGLGIKVDLDGPAMDQVVNPLCGHVQRPGDLRQGQEAGHAARKDPGSAAHDRFVGGWS